VYSGWLGVIYDSQVTNGSAGGRGSLKESNHGFLLVAWESHMTPSLTAKHFFIATRIKVNGLIETKSSSLWLVFRLTSDWGGGGCCRFHLTGFKRNIN
jgi:hypothetical protein